jgi:phosphopantothenoylcysteine decarboxylase/phosphopantothenate--cysteine ligase
LGYNGSLKNKKVLITCGPTWVGIDPVRVITNISSGELAHDIAQGLTDEKADVTLLQGPVTHQFSSPLVKVIAFTYVDDLSRQLKQELKKIPYDVIIHAAAVSDYELKIPLKRKITSRKQSLQLCLTPTQKLISQIKKINPDVFLVGFKLETDTSEKALIQKAQHLVSEADCDLVVANIVKKKIYQAYILDPNGCILAKANTRKKIATALIKVLKARL